MSVEIKQLCLVDVDGYEVMFDKGLGDSFTAATVSLDKGRTWYPARPLFMAMKALGAEFPEMVAEFEQYGKDDGLSPVPMDEADEADELQISDL